MPHAAVTEQQRSRAKYLRRAMTRAEILLWRYLKAHRLDGLAFRRQTPMGPYMVDFVCHSARLVVELDGETHDFDARQQHDAIRDAWLASRGYHVLRFTNEEVLSALEGVLTVIRETATARIRSAPPSLSLPRMGGGNPQTTAVPGGNAMDRGSRRARE
jgi:very-short-patch-repair endonuclease